MSRFHEDGNVVAIDPNGNTLTKTKAGVTTEFLYDIRNQLGEVQQGPSVLGRYGYDNEGLRILKIGDGGLRRYTYDQLSVVTEANESSTTVSKYDYGLDQLVSLDNTGEGRSFFHLDFLGSTANLTDGFGGTRQSILYDAWGNERDRVGVSANKFTFTGHEKDDETGLIYAKARFFDPEVGRFLNQDSYLGDVTNVPSLHRFVYANANPIRFVDPTGYASFEYADIENLRQELSNFYPSADDPTRGKVSWAQGNAGGMRDPSELVQFMLDQYGSKNAANTALDAWENAGSSFFAIVKLEPDDFNDTDEVRADKVFDDFIQEVGTYALELPFLKRDFLKMLNGATGPSSHDVSGVFSDAYSISAFRAFEEATGARGPHGKLVDESKMSSFGRGGRMLARMIYTTPSLLNQGLEGRAPRDFKTTYGILTALEVIPLLKSAGSLTSRLLTRGRTLALERAGLLGSQFAKNARTYLQAIEETTGVRLSQAQRARLIENLRTTRYTRLSPQAGQAHRKAFTQRVRDAQIAEWERQAGRAWPRYSEDVYNAAGKRIKRAGQRYDAHHVIENVYGGPHEWWNLTPARFPTGHQGGIHNEVIMGTLFP